MIAAWHIRTALEIAILAGGAAALLIWCRKKPHVLIAGTVLLLTSTWWLLARDVLKWALVKQAVPWPVCTQVGEDFRLRSLPEKFGHYVKVTADGELFRKPDGKPDGETILDPDILGALGIGTGYDKTRYTSRRSNWYLSRIYRDTREGPNSPYRYWQLDVTYYTGTMDTVPHIGEVCLVAGGAKPLATTRLDFSVPSARPPWNQVTFNRLPFLQTDILGIRSSKFLQYYTFSLNGAPETSREHVRLTLTFPWIRHCYFAKIQFGPYGSVVDLAETDRHAADFLRSFLPSVLENLPMPADIEKLTRPNED